MGKLIKAIREKFLRILVFTSLVLLLGGWVYFNRTIESISTPSIRRLSALIMAFQNCAESLLCNPILSIPVVFEDFDKFTMLEKVILLFYSLFLMAVPIIEAVVAFSVLDRVFRFLGGISKNKCKVLIVGFNEYTKKIIEATGDSFKKKYKICVWTDEVLSEEVLNDLYRKSVKVFSKENIDLTKTTKFDEKLSDFLESNKIERIILMNDSDARNIKDYITLSSCGFCKTHTVNFYVNIQDFEMKQVLNDYFDKSLKKRKAEIEASGETNKDTHMDLRVFNMSQIQAERLLSDENFPLYRHEVKKNSFDNSDIDPEALHLIIVGGGTHGREILYHAMNQGVLSPDNKIYIDVIDKDIDSVKDKLKERLKSVEFSEIIGKDEFKKTELKIKLPEFNETDNEVDEENIDDTLIITLREMDALASDFGSMLKSNLAPGTKDVFKHVVICLPDDESNLRAAREVCSHGPRNSVVAVRTDDNYKLREYFETLLGADEKSEHSSVYLYGSEMTLFGLESIINEDEEKEIKKYHLVYDSFNFDIGEIDNESYSYSKACEKWNEISSFKRDSNRALYDHRKVKNYFFEKSRLKGFFENNDDIKIPDLLSEQNRQRYNNDKKNDAEKRDAFIKIYYAEKLAGTKGNYEETLKFAQTEHRRWSYYVISEGWKYGSDRNDSVKVHDCLSKWNLLCRNKPDTIVYDLLTIRNLEQRKETKE